MSGTTFKHVYILSGKRTPFGAFGGSLTKFSANDLGVVAAKAALQQSGASPEQIDHVVFGNVVQTSVDAIYCARHVGLKAGIPQHVPAVTVNRLCGSGFEAIANVGFWIEHGFSKVGLAGGTESMSQAPFVVRGARWGTRMGHVPFEDMLTAALTDSYTGMDMANTAENLAVKYKISREEVDQYSYQTQMRTKAAQEKGLFKDELTPVTWTDPKKGEQKFESDEHPRPQTTLEALAKLKAVFKKDGVVTAGGASGMVDGAGALVIAHESEMKRLGSKPLGRLVGWGVAGCDPKIMGIGPVPAAQEALKATGMKLSDMDLVEINEAFAAQYLAVEKELGINREISNVNGSGIPIGHPLGTTGARITMHALYELRRRKKRYALVGACIGGGQGIALIVESV
jgi:acetyl-CoA acyltransferase 2